MGKFVVLWVIDKVKMCGVVISGDQLRIEVEMMWMKGQMVQVYGLGIVVGKVVCEVNLMFMMVDV